MLGTRAQNEKRIYVYTSVYKYRLLFYVTINNIKQKQIIFPRKILRLNKNATVCMLILVVNVSYTGTCAEVVFELYMSHTKSRILM